MPRLPGTDLITVRGPIMAAGPTTAVRAPLQSRLAIDLTMFAALVITQAAPITSGGQGTGRAMATFGSTAITSCGDTDRVVFRAIDIQTIGWARPQRAKRKRSAVARQPSPQRTLLRKLIADRK